MTNHLPAPVELTDAELDVVAAGVAAGLVAVNISDISVLDNSNNNVAVGIPITAAVAILGAAAAGELNQTSQHGRQ